MTNPNQPQQPYADLPAHARERLLQMRGQGGQRALFTSDLSVNEFLLVREAGFEPAGLVMGSSIYHVGYQRGRWSKNEEMQVLTGAGVSALKMRVKRACDRMRRSLEETVRV